MTRAAAGPLTRSAAFRLSRTPRRVGASVRPAPLLLLLLLAAAPSPQDQLRDAERARAADLAAQHDAAARAAAEAQAAAKLAAARAETAARLRKAEDALAAAADKVAGLARRRRVAEAALAARAAALRPLLPAIERLSLYPAETLLALPLPPEQAVRGAIVLSGLTHRLEADAAALRAEQAEVAALQAQLDAAQPALAEAAAAQKKLAADLDAELAAAEAARHAADDSATAAARRAEAEAAQAGTLRAVIARIETDRRAAEARARADEDAARRRREAARAAEAAAREAALASPAAPGLSDSHGAPVAGTVTRRFGEAGDAGPAEGETIATPPDARVTSPCAGRVAFAGPFRSYGLLLIVDCGGGYHVVLAGLGRLDAAVGRRVAAGDPVGVMSAWDPRDPSAQRPTLYIELRKDGAAVNPAPFLHAKS